MLLIALPQLHLTITPETLVTLAAAVVSILGWLRERKLLPAPLAKAVDAIGLDRLTAYVTNSAALVDKTPAQRREWAILQVTALCKREGLQIPEGFIRMMVEYAYQASVKRRL